MSPFPKATPPAETPKMSPIVLVLKKTGDNRMKLLVRQRSSPPVYTSPTTTSVRGSGAPQLLPEDQFKDYQMPPETLPVCPATITIGSCSASKPLSGLADHRPEGRSGH